MALSSQNTSSSCVNFYIGSHVHHVIKEVIQEKFSNKDTAAFKIFKSFAF